MKNINKQILFLTLMAGMTLQANAQESVQAQASKVVSNRAAAQNYDVLARPRPEYDAVGVQAGAFKIAPSVTTKAVYNDNIFAQKGNEQDDLIGVVTPEVAVKSNFGRHEISGKVGADIARFTDNTGENYENMRAELGGRADVNRDINFTANTNYGNLVEDRLSSIAPSGTTGPIEYQTMGGKVGANANLNRISLKASTDMNRYDYDDATAKGTLLSVDQDIRDMDVTGVNAEAGYEFSPGYRTFVRGRNEMTEYYNDKSAANRDSDSYRATAGVSAELTNLLVGEIEAGYMNRNYDNYKDFSGMAYGANLNWFASPLATARFSVDRNIIDSTTASAAASASGMFQTAYRSEVNLEVMRNVILTPKVGYIDGQYEGTNSEEQTYLAGASADYLINRNLAASLGYEYSTRDTSQDISALEYDRNLVMLSLKAKM